MVVSTVTGIIGWIPADPLTDPLRKPPTPKKEPPLPSTPIRGALGRPVVSRRSAVSIAVVDHTLLWIMGMMFLIISFIIISMSRLPLSCTVDGSWRFFGFFLILLTATYLPGRLPYPRTLSSLPPVVTSTPPPPLLLRPPVASSPPSSSARQESEPSRRLIAWPEKPISFPNRTRKRFRKRKSN